MAEGDYHPVESIGDIAALLDQIDAAPKPWPRELVDAPPRRDPPHDRQGIFASASHRRPARIFPRDGIVTCDVGSHKLVMGQFWRCYEPGTFFMSNGFSGMGFGLPAAIAAQLA